MTQTAAAILLHEADNVLIAREDMQATDPIPRGHKLARTGIAAGEPVHKYGQIIGFASRDIAAGDHLGAHP